MGLIKYLSDSLIKNTTFGKTNTSLTRESIEQKILNLDDQRNIARTWLFSHDVDKNKMQETLGIIDPDPNLYSGLFDYISAEKILRLKIDNVMKQQKHMINDYASDKIFNFKGSILEVLS